MKAKDLVPDQKFMPPGTDVVFTLAEPSEPCGIFLMMKVKERPDSSMTLRADDEVTLVE